MKNSADQGGCYQQRPKAMVSRPWSFFKEWPRSGNHRRPYQQLFRFKEVQRKTGLSDLWNVIHKEEKATLEHTVRLHTRKTIYLNLSLISKFCHLYLLISNLSLLTCTFFTFYRLSRYILSCKIFTLLFFSLENDDMQSSKRCGKLISLIFIIRCLTKCNQEA